MESLMKYCPQCLRRYDDTMGYCLIDGKALVSDIPTSSNLPATLVISDALEQNDLAAEKPLDDALSSLHPTMKDVVKTYERAASFHRSENYEEKIDACQQAIPPLQTALFRLHVNIGFAYKKLGKHEEAIEFYKKAISFQPNEANGHFGLGIIYFELEQYTEAIEYFKETVRLRSDDFEAYFRLGYTYGKLNLYQEAIEAYNQAITLKPDHAFAHNNTGAMLATMGRYDEALKAYKEAIRHDPDDAIAHSNLGFTYLKLNDKVTALEQYKILKKLDEKMAANLYSSIYK